MTNNIEKLLKKTRLDKQLSLDDVNRDLKIRKDHIKQFEKKIPELLGVYELGYLRCYAKHLGVETEVNNYIAYLKEKTKIASKNEKIQSESSITELANNIIDHTGIHFFHLVQLDEKKIAPVDLIRAYLYAWEDLKIDILWHKAKQQHSYNNRLNALFAVREKLCHEITQQIY